jgi:hypothetical protein
MTGIPDRTRFLVYREPPAGKNQGWRRFGDNPTGMAGSHAKDYQSNRLLFVTNKSDSNADAGNGEDSDVVFLTEVLRGSGE